MEAGSIFLISFAVIFSSLLIGGWWFTHSLLIRYTKRKLSHQSALQHSQTVSETTQELVETSEDARNLNWLYESHPISGRSRTSTIDSQLNPPSRASSASSILSSGLSQTNGCDNSYKITEWHSTNEPHDLSNMVAIPPIPKQSLSRRAADIGTQVSLLLPIIWHVNCPARPKSPDAHIIRHLQQHFSRGAVKTLYSSSAVLGL